MYKSFLSVKLGLSHFCLDFFLNLAMSQTFSKKKLQVADSTLVNFFEIKKISFQKKIQVWDLIGALIPHLYFFFEIENFSFSKKLQVLN